jgi:hypothetical protein
MAYGVNSPFGLRPYGHLISGVNDIKTNSNYTISSNSLSLNKGDPVVYTTSMAEYAITAGGYQGQQKEIQLYNPTVTLQAANNATTITTAPIVGVFQGCSYYSANGTYLEQEYWVAGTPVQSGTLVMATIIDDPYVIWDIQLGTYLGADQAQQTRFLLLPCLQIETATANWPNTGTATGHAGVAASSCVAGTNIALLTGYGSFTNGGAGATQSLATITLNGEVQNYADNPLIADQGTATGNPWGVSTFYACPSLAATTAAPSVTDGRNEYARSATTALTVIGFTPNPKNVPGTYGQPGTGTSGDYFNTAFLNVLVTINNHASKPGIVGLTPVV